MYFRVNRVLCLFSRIEVLQESLDGYTVLRFHTLWAFRRLLLRTSFRILLPGNFSRTCEGRSCRPLPSCLLRMYPGFSKPCITPLTKKLSLTDYVIVLFLKIKKVRDGGQYETASTTVCIGRSLRTQTFIPQ